MRFKHFVTTVLAVLAVGLLVGYGTAHARVPACKALFAQDLLSHQVQGERLGGGTVSPTPEQVASRVILPFSVELSLSLPRDDQRAQYFATCIALPWRLDLSFRSELAPL